MFTLFSVTLFAQDKKDTTIVQNGYEYNFDFKSGKPAILKNLTTTKQYSDLGKMNRISENESRDEHQRILEETRNEASDFKNFIQKTLKETFKESKLRDFQHTRIMDVHVQFKSNGAIINLIIMFDEKILDIVGYDKIIEYESKLRSGYKVKPFLNQNMKSTGRFMFTLKPEQLNNVFK